MITVKRDAIKYKDSEGNMQSAGVIANVGILGVDYARYAKIIQFTDDSELPSKVVLNLDTATSLASLFSNTTVQELTITAKQQITSMQRMIYPTKANALKKIVLNFDTSKVTNMTQAFSWIRGEDAEIVGELNLSSVTTMTTPFAYSTGLKEVRFAKETIKVSLFIDACSELSDATIQSVIDGLAIVEEAQILKFHVNVKPKLTEEQIATITSKNWTLA